jgi:hypothetical protein
MTGRSIMSMISIVDTNQMCHTDPIISSVPLYVQTALGRRLRPKGQETLCGILDRYSFSST